MKQTQLEEAGKVKEVIFAPDSGKSNLEFKYDPMGNRIAKIVKPDPADSSTWTSTFYVHDATGNVMATYEERDNDTSLYLNEQMLYGSSRLGLLRRSVNMDTTSLSSFSTHTLGKKQYELSNRTGDILTVISDKKIAVDINGDSITDYFMPVVLSSLDIYPGGFPQPNRSYSANSYRYGYNAGSEKDDEITGVTGANFTTFFREGDTRLLTWWTPDPKGLIQPWQSPYTYMDGNPLGNNDPLGDKIRYGSKDVKKEVKQWKKENKSEWKAIKKEYGGKEKDLFIGISDKVDASLSTASIEDKPAGIKKDIVTTQYWMQYNPNIDGDEGGITGTNPMTTIEPLGLPQPDVPNPAVQDRPAPPTPAIPRVNVNMGTPFVGNSANFSNATNAQNQLQRIASGYLNNPSATQIQVVISTNLTQNNLQQQLQNNMTLNQLMWQRGIAIQNQLQQMGVPLQAFPNNWLQFQFTTSPGTQVGVR